jgi:glucoamylase
MNAFGKPGIPPTWTSSAKDAVTASPGGSRLWATLGFGIINEVYWPNTGLPQIRDLGFIVAKPGYWVEVKRVARYRLSTPKPYLPLVQVVHEGEEYRLELEVLPDPSRDVLLVRYVLEGEGFQLYPLLAPHLGGSGYGNTAWVSREGLFASRGEHHLALLSRTPFSRGSAGYVGFSDGWQDFSRNGMMSWEFSRAEEGNVALMGELPGGEGILALGFAHTPEGARTKAAPSLSEGYTAIREAFLAAWEAWGRQIRIPRAPTAIRREAQLSAAVLKMHEDLSYPGAVVASLSIPWGNANDDLGGYHLVWVRDAVEAGFGFLAAGLNQDARRMLSYLIATQQPDGHWTQNFFPDGRPYWRGIQLDEVGFPILLAAKLHELGLLEGLHDYHRMIWRAAQYLAQHGPVSEQDRWEEDPGLSPFTLAVEIAALLSSLEFLDPQEAAYARSLALSWNETLELWVYAQGTPLAQEHGVAGYYVRIAPGGTGWRGRVEVKNRGGETLEASQLVSLDFLYLVRLGLRAPDDPRILASLKVAEELLKVETPSGVFYHRYNDDGYGEHPDGSPFDGSGVGRAWPLLTGERGCYGIERGEDALPYLQAMIQASGPGGLIPEQVWDAPPIPERGLYPGKPTGSAMPLVWAHAEFLKLLYASHHGSPIDRNQAILKALGPATAWHWRKSAPFGELPKDRDLLIEAAQPFTLHYGHDGWQEVQDRAARPLGLGMFGVLLKREELRGWKRLEFTRCFEKGWENTNSVLEL